MAAKTQDAAGEAGEKYLRAALTPIVNDAMKRARVRAQMPELPDSRQFVDAIVRVVDETSAAAREDDLRRALAKVRAHTGLPPAPTPELMRGMLASIERIADAALAATPPAPDAVPNEPPSVLIAMLDNIEDELRDCTAGLEREPTLRNDLIALADRLNHVVTSLDKSPADRIPAPSEDTARLDELERVANAAGGIHLHDGSHAGCNGLGLAGTGRTLRQAVDAMRVARASVRRFADAAASLPRGGADV